MVRRLDIGAVSYLNTKPLVFGLAQSEDDLHLVYDLPSRLADRLARRELDAALIPSYEFLRRTDYLIVSDACIGCRGPVLSVKLFCSCPLAEIRSLALDEGSRTSVVMVQILLERLYGIRPALQGLPIGQGLSDATADAVLLIGDRAIHARSDRYAPAWDLGQVWNEVFGAPFVFAVWASRADLPESVVDRLTLALGAARDRGIQAIETIASAEHATVGLTVGECANYLRNHLHFYLEPRELAGLDLYRREALALGFLNDDTPIRWHDCETA